MKFRNEDMMSKLERHPLRANLAKALDIAESFRGDAEFVTGNKDLSPQGRQKAMQGKLRSAVRDLRDARGPLAEMQSKLEAKRAVVKQPAFDRTNLVGAMLRQEIRTALRGMDPGARASVLLGPNADPVFADAMLEQPSMLSGMTMNENFLVDAVRAERLQGLFGPELAEIAELEAAIAEAEMVCDLARVDPQDASGMDSMAFASFVEPIEQKKNAPWLIQHNPADPVVVIFPENEGTPQFQRIATEDERRDDKFMQIAPNTMLRGPRRDERSRDVCSFPSRVPRATRWFCQSAGAPFIPNNTALRNCAISHFIFRCYARRGHIFQRGVNAFRAQVLLSLSQADRDQRVSCRIAHPAVPRCADDISKWVSLTKSERHIL